MPTCAILKNKSIDNQYKCVQKYFLQAPVQLLKQIKQKEHH